MQYYARSAQHTTYTTHIAHRSLCRFISMSNIAIDIEQYISKDGFPWLLTVALTATAATATYLVNVVVSICYISFEYKKRGFPPPPPLDILLRYNCNRPADLSQRRCQSQKLSTTTNLEWKLVWLLFRLLLYLTFFSPLGTDKLKAWQSWQTILNHDIDFFAVITDFFVPVHFCA